MTEQGDPGGGQGPAGPEGVAASAPAAGGAAAQSEHSQPHTMIPSRERRRFGIERLLVRLVATCGIIGIGVVIAAIMVSNHSHGWLVGVVVSVVSVVLAAILWSSRQL